MKNNARHSLIRALKKRRSACFLCLWHFLLHRQLLEGFDQIIRQSLGIGPIFLLLLPSYRRTARRTQKKFLFWRWRFQERPGNIHSLRHSVLTGREQRKRCIMVVVHAEHRTLVIQCQRTSAHHRVGAPGDQEPALFVEYQTTAPSQPEPVERQASVTKQRVGHTLVGYQETGIQSLPM